MTAGGGAAEFPAVLFVAGPQAAAPGVEAGRTHAIWRALCQCAETWRLNLWAGVDMASTPRLRFAATAQAEAVVRGLLAESRAKIVVLAAGAGLNPAIFPSGVRVVGIADAEGLVPSAATEIWAPDGSGATPGRGRKLHAIADHVEPSETEAGRGDPIAALTSVAAAIGMALPDDPAAIGALVARNLSLRTMLARSTFNTRLRLLHCQYDVQGVAPDGCLSGNVRRADGIDEGLVNAWVQTATPAPGMAGRLRATAALAPAVNPADVVVDLAAWGWPLAPMAGDEALEYEQAGIAGLAVAPDGRSAEAVYWGVDSETEIQFGKKRQSPGPVATDAEGTSIFRAASAWPLDRNTLTVLPPEGFGPRFSNFRIFEEEYRPTSAKFGAMRNSLKGQSAWLIGNGPSVRVEDLDRLADAGVTCFCFNRFHLAHGSTRLRAQFTVTGDLQMIEDFGQQIVDESGGTVFVADQSAPRLIGDYVWLRQISVFPSLFSFDPDLIVTPGGSSVYVAMQIGYFLGIRRWYLYGNDFSFQSVQPTHGAGAFRSASGDGNHFIANYRSGQPWCPPAIENILPSFFGARMLMESEGGYIRNATHGGHMHVFERMAFDDALNESR